MSVCKGSGSNNENKTTTQQHNYLITLCTSNISNHICSRPADTTGGDLAAETLLRQILAVVAGCD